jgi:hypothetical protein
MPRSKKIEGHVEYWVALMRFEHRRAEALELIEEFGYTQKQLNHLRLALVTKLPPPEMDAAPVRGIKPGYEGKKKQPKYAIPPPYPIRVMLKDDRIRVVVKCANSGTNVLEGEMDLWEEIEEKTFLEMAAKIIGCKVKMGQAFIPPVPNQLYILYRV